jgi:hypothetical protein
MFKSISWQEYLYAIGVISLGYYAIVAAIFYSRDILSKLKGAAVPKTSPSQPAPKRNNQNFMGAISKAAPKKIPIKESTAFGDELFIDSNPEELMAAQCADSPAAELFERLDNTFQIMEGERKKANYVKNIKTLIRQYCQFKDTPVQQEISVFIRDQFRDHPDVKFEVEEIDILWLDEKEEVIIQSSTKNNYEK